MCDESRVAPKDAAGAPEKESEVTEAMIEAGVKASCLYDRDDQKSWEVAAVYEAMEHCRRAASHGSGSSLGNAVSPSRG